MFSCYLIICVAPLANEVSTSMTSTIHCNFTCGPARAEVMQKEIKLWSIFCYIRPMFEGDSISASSTSQDLVSESVHTEADVSSNTSDRSSDTETTVSSPPSSVSSGCEADRPSVDTDPALAVQEHGRVDGDSLLFGGKLLRTIRWMIRISNNLHSAHFHPLFLTC